MEELKFFDNKLQNYKDDEHRKKTEAFQETTHCMVESNEHCFGLLQIVKEQTKEEMHVGGLVSSTKPVNAVYQPNPSEPAASTMASQAASLPGRGRSPSSSSLISAGHVNLSPNTFIQFSCSSMKVSILLLNCIQADHPQRD